MNKVEKIGDNLYIRNGITGYRIVYPIKDEYGNMIWKNLIYGGSLWNLIKVLFIFLVLFLIMFAYKHDTQGCRDTLNNLSSICAQVNYVSFQENQSNQFKNQDWSDIIPLENNNEYG